MSAHIAVALFLWLMAAVIVAPGIGRILRGSGVAETEPVPDYEANVAARWRD